MLSETKTERQNGNKSTLIFASRRLNIGAFLSMSGMIIYLQRKHHQHREQQ